jgi:RNA polymerase sigma factor (sigma-70 family)
MQDESEIWRQFKEGDEKAYEWLYTQYFFLLFRYGRKIVADKELIKDCIQDLFVDLWKSRQQLSEPRSVKAYLLVCLRRHILRQSDGRFQALQETHDLETVEPHEWHLIEDETVIDRKKQITQAIKTLTKRQQEVVFLKFYSNLPYDEIAQVMDITKDAVYVLVSKALTAIQKKILSLSLLFLMLVS